MNYRIIKKIGGCILYCLLLTNLSNCVIEGAPQSEAHVVHLKPLEQLAIYSGPRVTGTETDEIRGDKFLSMWDSKVSYPNISGSSSSNGPFFHGSSGITGFAIIKSSFEKWINENSNLAPINFPVWIRDNSDIDPEELKKLQEGHATAHDILVKLNCVRYVKSELIWEFYAYKHWFLLYIESRKNNPNEALLELHFNSMYTYVERISETNPIRAAVVTNLFKEINDYGSVMTMYIRASKQLPKLNESQASLEKLLNELYPSCANSIQFIEVPQVPVIDMPQVPEPLTLLLRRPKSLTHTTQDKPKYRIIESPRACNNCSDLYCAIRSMPYYKIAIYILITVVSVLLLMYCIPLAYRSICPSTKKNTGMHRIKTGYKSVKNKGRYVLFKFKNCYRSIKKMSIKNALASLFCRFQNLKTDVGNLVLRLKLKVAHRVLELKRRMF